MLAAVRLRLLALDGQLLRQRLVVLLQLRVGRGQCGQLRRQRCDVLLLLSQRRLLLHQLALGGGEACFDFGLRLLEGVELFFFL